MKRLLKRACALCLVLIPVFSIAAEPLDINSATADQLAMALSGVGNSKRKQSWPTAMRMGRLLLLMT
jgi:competence protein ComEA